MEHLNREAKKGVTGLGANITEHAVTRVGNALGETINLLQHCDEINDIRQLSGHHSRRSVKEDMTKLLKQLQDSQVFTDTPGRIHKKLSKV